MACLLVSLTIEYYLKFLMFWQLSPTIYVDKWGLSKLYKYIGCFNLFSYQQFHFNGFYKSEEYPKSVQLPVLHI